MKNIWEGIGDITQILGVIKVHSTSMESKVTNIEKTLDYFKKIQGVPAYRLNFVILEYDERKMNSQIEHQGVVLTYYELLANNANLCTFLSLKCHDMASSKLSVIGGLSSVSFLDHLP